MNTGKSPSFKVASISFLFLLFLLLVSLTSIETALGLPTVELEPHIPFFIAALFAAVIAIKTYGIPWQSLEEEIVVILGKGFYFLLSLLVCGMILGTWAASGVNASLVHTAISFVSKGLWIPVVLILGVVISYFTGSLLASLCCIGSLAICVGNGFDIPPYLVGAAVITSIWFGLRLSPRSEHFHRIQKTFPIDFKSYLKTILPSAVPSFVLACIVLLIYNFQLPVQTVPTALDLNALNNSFNVLSPLMILAPIVIILLLHFKCPLIPSLFAGAFTGALLGLAFGNFSLSDALNSFQYGYSADLPKNLSGFIPHLGGMSSSLKSISLLICVWMFSSVVFKAGMLDALLKPITVPSKNNTFKLLNWYIGTLLYHLLGSNTDLTLSSNMHASINSLPPKHRFIMVRLLADSAFSMDPLIPWSASGAAIVYILNCAPFAFVPFCIMNLALPFISLILLTREHHFFSQNTAVDPA